MEKHETLTVTLTGAQLSLIFSGLSALAEAADYENSATDDPDIHKANDATLRAVSDLTDYLKQGG